MAIPALRGRAAGVRARGLADTAAAGGPGRESLCKAGAAGGKARFETAHTVIKAPDLNLAFLPAKRRQAAWQPPPERCEAQ